jgi:hypothetical protein
MDELPISRMAGMYEILLKASQLHRAAKFTLLLLKYSPVDPIPS